MSEPLKFGPRPKPHAPQTLVDKLQVLLLEWPEAGASVERYVDQLLAELDKSQSPNARP